MSKLDDLIKELCPNGVEYKPLGEIANIFRGGNFQKRDFCEKGIPCIHYGQIYTKFGLFIDVTTMWGCSILLSAIAAFVFKWSVPIVYIILMSDEIIKVPLCTIRFKTYKWLNNITR